MLLYNSKINRIISVCEFIYIYDDIRFVPNSSCQLHHKWLKTRNEHCTFMWAQRALDVKAHNGMKKKRKKNTNRIVISIEWNTHSNLTPEGMDFSHSIYISEWRHHRYNNLVKATLKWILLLHATPTASDTPTIILFI